MTSIMTPMAMEARRRLEQRSSALQRWLATRAEGDRGPAHIELTDTQAALARIADGTYGRCMACGGAVGRQRLLALPAARFCIACAAQH